MAAQADEWCSFYTRTVLSVVMQKQMLKDVPFKEEVVELFVSRTMGNLMECKDLGGRCNFDIKEVVFQTIRRVIDSEVKRDAANEEAFCVVYAPTQSGKSAYKAVELACYISMGMLTILCTKGKTEASGLASKFKLYFKGSVFEARILDIYKERSLRGTVSKFTDEKSGLLGCTLIIPDTKKIGYACDLIQSAKKKFKRLKWRFSVAVILDECDAIESRSADESQENEKAMAKLRALGLTVETRVTATPIPTIMQWLKKNDGRSFKLIELPTQKDYLGVERLRLTEKLDFESMDDGYLMEIPEYFGHSNDNKGKKGMFEEDKQQKAKKFPKSYKHHQIPAWNEQCNNILELAFEEISQGKKGGLILVGTCTGVDRDRNIFQQAAKVQDLFGAGGREFISVAAHAGKIFYRLPDHRYGYESKMSIDDFGEFLSAIDEEKTLGFKIPVVVFGYHALKRSTSWRSDTRVPTHLIMYHRKGQSIENVCQAAGRATFNGRNFLIKNMNRDYIPTAMIKDDFNLVNGHCKCIRSIIEVCNTDDESASRKRKILQLIEEFRKGTKRKSGVHDIYRSHVKDDGKGGTKRKSSCLDTPHPLSNQPRTVTVDQTAGTSILASSTGLRQQPNCDASMFDLSSDEDPPNEDGAVDRVEENFDHLTFSDEEEMDGGSEMEWRRAVPGVAE